MEITDIEVQLRQRLNALGPAPRAELLHVLMPASSADSGTKAE